jgi:hypothetical protein
LRYENFNTTQHNTTQHISIATRCLALSAMLALPTISLAQKWDVGGNTIAIGNFIGNTNNIPLQFKVNNTQVASFANSTNAYLLTINNGLTVSGATTLNSGVNVTGLTNTTNLRLSAYTGTNLRLLKIDANGLVSPITMATSTEILNGLGNWVKINTLTGPQGPQGLPGSANAWGLNGTAIGANSYFIGSTDNTDLKFKTNNLEAMRILANGSVGIGTTAPTFKLDVNGNAHISTDVTVGNATSINLIKTTSNNTTLQEGAININILNNTLLNTSAIKTFTKNDQYILENIGTITRSNGGTSTSQTFSITSAGVVNAKQYLISGVPLAIPAAIWQQNAPTAGYNYTSLIMPQALSFGSYLRDPSEALRTFVIQNPLHTGMAVGSYNYNDLINFEGENPTLIFKDQANANGNGQAADLLIAAAEGSARFVTNDGFAFFMNADNTPRTPGGLQNNFMLLTNDSYFSGAQKTVLNITPKGELTLNTDDATTPGITLYNSAAAKNAFVVKGDGHTQIGLLKPTIGSTHADAMLSVYGKIVAKSCFVSTANWADYVFEPNYALPNLYELETYYKANKHLPEIPTQAQVIENGIDLAQMNTLLLKKIEEITLHMVQQQKEIDALKATVK